MSLCLKTITGEAVVIGIPDGTTCASVGATDVTLRPETLTLDQSIELAALVLAMWATAWVFKQLIRLVRNI